MYKLASLAVACAVLSTPALADQTVQHNQRVFENPCERGPLPHVSIINNKRAAFVGFLRDVRPTMPQATADLIAYEMCADMSLVGDSEGLTSRLNTLLRKYGY